MPVAAPIAAMAAASAGASALATAAVVAGTSLVSTKIAGGSWGDAFKSAAISGATSFAGSSLSSAFANSSFGQTPIGDYLPDFVGSAQANVNAFNEGLSLVEPSAFDIGVAKIGNSITDSGFNFADLAGGGIKAMGKSFMDSMSNMGETKSEGVANIIQPNLLSNSTVDTSIKNAPKIGGEVKPFDLNSMNGPQAVISGGDKPQFAFSDPAQERKAGDASKKLLEAEDQNKFFAQIFADSVYASKKSNKMEPSQFANYNFADVVFNGMVANG